MVTFKEQDVAIKPGSNLQTMVDQAQYERMEVAACWSYRKEFTCGRDVEDVEEDLVVVVSPCVRWLECAVCDKVYHTSFGKAKMRFGVPLNSAMICVPMHSPVY